MESSARVLDAVPVTSLAGWEAAGGRKGLDAARAAGGDAVLAAIDAAGLRGRGGAGFPTATKWRSVIANRSPDFATTVVVNGAEGEPGSFKDRAILLANPYRVLEGALIAAMVVGADEIVVALKESAPRILDRVRSAAAEIADAGWAPGVSVDVVAGPGAYLYGEETALLEVIEGREPFPRIAPPWRRGIDDFGDDTALSGDIQMAGPDDESESPPALVNNVETMANLPAIVSEGPEWFRSIGTDRSPGSLVVTITGRTRKAGVAEVPMGTSLREVIAEVGGGARVGRVTAVLPGVSSAALSGDALDVPLTYEDMAAAGTGLGAGSYYVLDEGSDPVAVAQGVSRFLAVESCGQCAPCKQDGKAVSVSLDRLRRSDPGPRDLADIANRLGTITRGARCSLATQHQVVVQSLLDLFPQVFDDHAQRRIEAADPVLIAEVVDLEGNEVVLDEAHAGKQPDWTFDAVDSGASPAERLNQLAGET